jgi:sucrose-6-phosphate hydrolase SacC (GH32 family)
MNNSNDKLHYKMYKAGKKWVIAGIFSVSLGYAAWNGAVNSYADANATSSNAYKVIDNSKQSSSTDQDNHVNTQVTDTAVKTTDNNAQATDTAVKTTDNNAQATDTAVKTTDNNAQATDTAVKTTDNNTQATDTVVKTTDNNAQATDTAVKTTDNNTQATDTVAKTINNNAQATDTAVKTTDNNSQVKGTATKTTDNILAKMPADSKLNANTNNSNVKSSNQKDVHDKFHDFNYAPYFNTTFNQNYHYNNPEGFSNDVQSIVPVYNDQGKVNYWKVYYLTTPYVKNSFYSSSWYGLKTKDFVNFSPLVNEEKSTSTENIAIPDASYKDENGRSVQVQSNNHNGIPWGYVATGTVVSNKLPNKSQMFTKDQWGNSIDEDAELSYFSTFGGNGASNQGQQAGIYLAYSNHGEQFHPYSDKAVVDSSIVGTQPSSDFRDPYVTTNGKDGLIMYVAGGLNHKMFTLTSKDGLNWKHNPKNDVKLDGLVETPNIQTINNKTVMFFSAQPSLENKLGFTKYVTGKLDDKGIFKPTGSIKNLDDGTDFYAGNYVKIDNNTVVNIGWLGDWIYTPSIWNTDKFLGGANNEHNGSFTMPRVLQSNKSGVTAIPIEPGQATLDYHVKLNSASKNIKIPSSKKVEVNFNSSKNKNIYLVRNNNNNVKISLNNGKMTVTRTEQGTNVINKGDHDAENGAMNTTTSTSLNSTSVKRVVLYIDNDSVEIYLPQVKKMFTVEDIPNEVPNQAYTLSTDNAAKVKVYSFNGSVDNNYIAKQMGILNNSYAKLKNNIATDSATQKSTLSYIKTNLTNASRYVNKSNELNGDSTANVYLAIANHYLSNANYWKDVLTDLKTQSKAIRVVNQDAAKVVRHRASYVKSTKALNGAKNKLAKKHTKANVVAYKKALKAYYNNKSDYEKYVGHVYNKSTLALKFTNGEVLAAKHQASVNDDKVSRIKKEIKMQHTKKVARKLSAEYNIAVKNAKASQKHYKALVAKQKAMAKYARELANVKNGMNILRTKQASLAKAKSAMIKHHTKKNRAAYANISKDIKKLKTQISVAERYISKNTQAYK